MPHPVYHGWFPTRKFSKLTFVQWKILKKKCLSLENVLVALTIEIGDGSCFLYWKSFWIRESCKHSLFPFWTKKIRLYFLKKSSALAQKCFAGVAAMWHYQQDKRFQHGNFQKGASTMVQKSLWIRNLSNDTTYAMLRHSNIQGVCCSDVRPTLKSHMENIKSIF